MQITKNYLTRKKDALYPDGFRYLSAITKITIHHSGDGVKVMGTHDDLVRKYHLYHQNVHGWGGIGYCFSIHESGSIQQHYDLTTVGWHDGVNWDSIGILMIGDMRKDMGFNVATKEQLHALQFLLDDLTQNHPEFPAGQNDVVNHGERMSTSCPADLTPLVVNYRNTGELYSDIKKEMNPKQSFDLFETMVTGVFPITNANKSGLVDFYTNEVKLEMQANSAVVANYENDTCFMTKYSYDRKIPAVFKKSEWKLQEVKVIPTISEWETKYNNLKSEFEKDEIDDNTTISVLKTDLENIKNELNELNKLRTDLQDKENKAKELQEENDKLIKDYEILKEEIKYTDTTKLKELEDKYKLIIANLENKLLEGKANTDNDLTRLSFSDILKKYHTFIDNKFESNLIRSFFKYDVIYILYGCAVYIFALVSNFDINSINDERAREIVKQILPGLLPALGFFVKFLLSNYDKNADGRLDRQEIN